ncbi:MAG: PEGA domain-containing protein, partial [Planctomycetota bacterium]
MEVKIDGYVDWRQSLDVTPDKEITIDAKLQIKTGTVTVMSEPTNAKVMIEGKDVGTTPVTMADLTPGTFNVEIMMEGYEDWKESVDVISDKTNSLTAKLQMKHGSVSIKSEPAEATVLLDEKEAGTTPVTISDLKPGTHNLEVMMDGYEKWIEKIHIKSDEENTITAVLREITGSIDIKSKPPKAIIYLDGEEFGTTPDTIKSIAVGSHEVAISIEGYKSWKKSINISKGKNKDINAILQIINGTLSIMSEPTNAKTLLDGKEVGKTPVTITALKPDTYNVEIVMDGFNNWKESIDVIPDNEISLSATLIMKPGSVSIKSEPAEATVLLDEKEAGTTPVTISDLKPGTHNLEIMMDGYEKWNEKVNIKPDEENSFTAVLRKITGSISVKSNPTNAILYMDGQDIGTTPNDLSALAVGLHEFEAVLKGYKNWKKSVNIKKGKNKNINAVLQINPGSVSIKSDPSNAMVHINGKEFDSTPVTITDLNPGKHNVEVKMDGYEDWKENIEIIPGKEIALTPTLQMKVGSVMIESEPAGALVLIDDKEVGNTPITITDLRPAIHSVEIRKVGYANWSENIDIIPDKEIPITAALQVKAGSVTIKSDPTAAKAIIDEKEVGSTPVTITDLKPGTHNIKVIMDGYDDWKECVEIIPDKEIILTAALQINTGTLSIASEPSDAMVIIDDKETGTTPITIIDLKSGTHIVTVRMDGYDDWRDSVDVKPDKETTLTAKLQKKAGSVSINSDPPGAKTFIDDKEVGVTPKIIADLIPGKYNVEIIKGGYVNWNKSVKIVPGKEVTLSAELQLKTGAVSIKSEPSGAMTLIDDKEAGTTPVTITDMKPGMHNVEISMTGYENWYEKVDIKSDFENSFKAILHKITGSITIKSNPSNANIYLDGEEVGITPVNLSSVAIGLHEIELRIEGYTSWKSSININKGKNKKIKTVLQKNTGSFSIKSNPSNAKVLIDDNEAGMTPVTKTDLKPGTYNIEVMKDGYENWNESIEITPDKEITLKPVLQIQVGAINLKSKPSDAKALINGREVGTTPVSITELKPGPQYLEVRMDGYDDWKESIEIIPGKEMELIAVLQLKVGSLSIKSNPPDAQIVIDSKEIGVTPKTITDLGPGTHNVKLRKEGYENWIESVDIIPDKEIHLAAVLQLKIGSIDLKSNPSNAKALIDGREIGTTPVSITDLKPGTHYLEVRMDGYDDWRESLDIIPGKEIPLMASLQMKVGALSIMSN